MTDRSPEQRAAIAARDRDVFLEAGAGTGKTSVLVGRYCDAVSEDGVPTDAILAFTFTERAAGELRSRIRAELLRRSAVAREAGEDEPAEELARAARDSERAWISTIHGFCRRLLSSHPLAAGLDPHFRVLDEPEAGRLAERAFDAALENLTVERDAAALVAAGYRTQSLRSMIRAAYEQLRGQGAAEPALPEACPPRESKDGDGPSAEELEELRRCYEALRELLAAFGTHYERLKAERSGLDFEDLQLRAVALLRASERVRELWRGRFAHILVDEFQDTNRLQLALLDELQGPETRLFTVGDEQQSIYGFRHADLAVFRQQRERALAAAGDGRVVLPLSGSFRSRPEVIAAANAIGSALLEGFRELTVGRLHDDEPPSGAPAVELLLTKTDGWNGSEDGDGPALATASDSTPSRVAEARSLAARLRELADAGVARSEMVVLLRAFTHVTAHEEALERAGLAPYVVGGRGYWSHQQVEDLICLLSAIANPLDDERLLGALSGPGCGASADALWLLRRLAGERRHIWPVLARHFGGELEEGSNGDAPQGGGEQQQALFADPEDERERMRRERVERYVPAFPPEDVERLRGFHATLTELRERAPLLALEALVERCAREFGYDLVTLARDGGRRRLANVRKLMRLAREFELREGRDLRAFLDYATERAADDREGEAATEAEGVDGVRIMTVHAAKGLEFPVVAVADLGRALITGGGPHLRLGPLEAEGEPRVGLRLIRAGRETVTLGELEELTEEQTLLDAAEELRLAYVAATRAEQRLILSGTFKEGDLEPREELPASTPVIARLMRALGIGGEDGQVLSVPGPRARPGLEASFAPGEIRVRVSEASLGRIEELSRTSAAPPSASLAQNGAARTPPLAELREAPPPGVVGHLSYSALSDYARCGYRFYVERVLGLAPPARLVSAEDGGADSDELASEADLGEGDPRPLARERRFGYGSAVHALLEWSARNRWAAPGRERCAAALRQEGLAGDEGEVERALQMVERWLDSGLRRSLERPLVRTHPEASFLLSLGGTVVRGKIDLLCELPDGELLVVDYKTDALGRSSPEEHMARYETQRALYAIAAAEGMARRGGSGNEERAVRTAYAFLDSEAAPVERAYAPADLLAARGELEGLVAAIRAERFEVTPNPHRALCFDCPARARLCIHPPERTLAPAR